MAHTNKENRYLPGGKERKMARKDENYGGCNIG